MQNDLTDNTNFLMTGVGRQFGQYGSNVGGQVHLGTRVSEVR